MEGAVETAWQPDPLCAPPPPGAMEPAQSYQLALAAAENAAATPAALDFRATDFLRVAVHDAPRDAAEAALNKYGCGTCGPRGFYGTLDVGGPSKGWVLPSKTFSVLS